MTSQPSSPHKSTTPSISVSDSDSFHGFPEEDLRPDGENNSGYFPARLGQPLDGGRFCIVRKLGWGQYSNVWLAKDKKDDRFVALKILTREATEVLQPGDRQRSDELRLLEKVSSAQPDHPGFRHNVLLHHSFEFEGPHGKHLCIATEVLGFSLNHVRRLRADEDGDLRVVMSWTKRFAKQILYGLDYLHSACDIIHTDLKHDNILFRLSDVPAIVATELVEDPSVSYSWDTKICPTIIPVVSQPLPVTTKEEMGVADLEAVIADLGHSHWEDHHFQEIIQPGGLRAPEVILGYPWDASADIWNFGCLITELLIGFWLFEYDANGDAWGAEEDHLARMTEALEETFDPAFLAKCKHRTKFFNPDGTFAHFTTHEEPTWPLEKLITTFALFNTENESAEGAASFLRRCLRLLPEERATAQELINDPWFADVDV